MGTQVFNAKPIAKSDVAHVLGEAIRQPDHCLHVTEPKAPQFLIGTPEDYEAMMAVVLHSCETVKRMRKNRSGVEKPQAIKANEAVMVAGIASYPDDLAKEEPELFRAWLDKTVEFLRQEYGDSLRSAMVHLDEAHPHIHFFVVPDDLDVATVFEPHRIRRENPTLTKHEMKKQELEALRRQQDRYQEQVGMYTGLARFGPRSRSLKRGEWKREQGQRIADAKRFAELSQEGEVLSQQRKQLVTQINTAKIKLDQRAAKRGYDAGARIKGWIQGVIQHDALEEAEERHKNNLFDIGQAVKEERTERGAELAAERLRNKRLNTENEQLTATVDRLSAHLAAHGVSVDDVLNPLAAPAPSVRPSPSPPVVGHPNNDGTSSGPK